MEALWKFSNRDIVHGSRCAAVACVREHTPSLGRLITTAVDTRNEMRPSRIKNNNLYAGRRKPAQETDFRLN